jgi:hypothetical protein
MTGTIIYAAPLSDTAIEQCKAWVKSEGYTSDTVVMYKSTTQILVKAK